jgi:predicted protein tyrosine phosphatase
VGDVKVFVGGVGEATVMLQDHKFDVAVSLADPHMRDHRPINLGMVPRVLKLDFHDKVLEVENHKLINEKDAADLVAFLKKAIDDGCESFLFHCFAGMSRSTAATMVFLYLRFGEEKLAERMLAIRPQAVPNRYVVWLCEEALGLHDTRPISNAIDAVEEKTTAPVGLISQMRKQAG